MYWGLTLVSISLTIGTLTTFVLAYLGWTRRRDIGALPFILLMLAIGLWSLAYTFELNTPLLDEKILWHKISYIGIPYVPVCWLVFNAQVLRYRFAYSPLLITAFSVIPFCVTILTLTLEYHQLVWGDLTLVLDRGLFLLDLERTSEFLAYSAYSYSLLFFGTLFFIRILLRAPSMRMPMIWVLASGVTIAIILNALRVIFGVELSIPFDLSPLMLAIIGGTAGWCVFRFGPLDVLSIARHALLENISEGFIVLRLSGRVASLNGAAQKMIGVQEVDAIGLTLDELMPEDYLCIDPQSGNVFEADWAAIHDRHLQSATVQQTHYELRLSSDGVAGEELYIDLSINYLFDQRNRPRGMLLVLRDVSQQKRTQQAFMQAQRMESAGVLAGGVAHDFNNLLAAIQMRHQLAQNLLKSDTSNLLGRAEIEGHAEQLNSQDLWGSSPFQIENSQEQQIGELLTAQWTSMTQPVLRHISIAGNAVERAADLTRQLLAFTGKGQFKVEPVDINRLIEENRALFAAAVPKDVELRIALSAPRLFIDSDRGQLQQVLMNLLLNAVEATDKDAGGVIDLETDVCQIELEEAQHYIWKNGPQPGTYVRLLVRDQGVGMTPDILSRIFEPFFTTKPDSRGLGLSAVLGAIHLYDGGMRASSKQNGGTEFKALFPVSESLTNVSCDEEQHLGQTNIAHVACTVLVADDEPPVLDVLGEILTDMGLNVLKATNGKKAVEIYGANQDKIDFVLLDTKMPVMGGVEALAAMRKLSPQLCALLSSGYSEREVSQTVTWDSRTDFLPKPYDIDTLVEKIEHLLKSTLDSNSNDMI